MKRIKIVIADTLILFCEDLFGTNPAKMEVYQYKYNELKRTATLKALSIKTDQDRLDLSRLNSTIEYMYRNAQASLVHITRVDDVLTAAKKAHKKAIRNSTLYFNEVEELRLICSPIGEK